MSSDLTKLCEHITYLAGKQIVFTAMDVTDLFCTISSRSPESQAVGQAFRICAKNGVIVKVAPVQSKGEGRNGSLVWSWRGC